MKKLTLFMILVLIFLARPALIHADDHGDHNRVELRFREEMEDNDDGNVVENEENENDEDEEQNEQVEINDQRFELKGEITAISDNAFTVLGQTITIDPAQVPEFQQRGELKVGAMVKVEGVVVNDTKFAQEIRVLTQASNQGKNNDQFEVRLRGTIEQLISQIKALLPALSKS